MRRLTGSFQPGAARAIDPFRLFAVAENRSSLEVAGYNREWSRTEGAGHNWPFGNDRSER